MPDTYELVAIGAGPAGESAAELAAFFGHRSAIIERDQPGGTVATTGGAPTKTLREAALYLTGFSQRDIYGLRMPAPPEVVMEVIRARTQAVCELLQKVTADNIASSGVDYIRGVARLDSDGSVIVDSGSGENRRIRAKTVLIASGSRPFRPENVPFGVPGICDTDTVLKRGWIPKDILIAGAGPVGVEFATVCYGLGARVTLIDRGRRLIAMMDGEVAARLERTFREWGITVLFGSTVKSAAANGDGLMVTLSTGQQFSPDTLLFAAGRVSNTQGLGLEALGVELDARGRIVVDQYFQTSVPGIYAAGDVVRPTLASVAMEQGRVAICHAFGIPFEGTVDPCPVSAIYGMPEVSGAGATEEQCRAQGLDYEVGRADLGATPRGAIAGRGGLLKLVFLKADRRLLGVHCIGDIASEIVGIGQMLIRCGGSLNTIANMSLNTPTYSYAYKYAAFDGLRRLASADARAGER